MDFGDIVRLLFFAFIFLSFFGGLIGRKSGEEEEQPQRPRPRPTDIFESGGEQPHSRPVATNRPVFPMFEQQAERETPDAPERHRQDGPRQYARPDFEAVTEEDRSAGLEARHEEAQRRYGTRSDRGEIASSGRELVERDITMDTDPERRPRRRPSQQVVARRSRRTGGDVLHRSLTNPETLERAFIVKEVLDKPLGLRAER